MPEGPSAAVFAPSPLLTVTVERSASDPEVHLHAGGQGVWVARMVHALGVDVVLCGSFGGEAGHVVRTLVEGEGICVRAVEATAANGAYVHDRRSGGRREIAEMAAKPLSRHDIDALYEVMVVEALESTVSILTGPQPSSPPVLPHETHRRLAGDLRANGVPVVADLAGKPLTSLLEGGVTVLRVSHEELLEDGRAAGDDVASLLEAMRELAAAGADHVVVSRAAEPTLALLDGEPVEVVAPPLEPVDDRGGGDAMTAGIAAALARGADLPAAVRLGAAAGRLNVTRRGLATGGRSNIERLAEHVDVRPLDEAGDG